jgi:hypothetical protein
MVTCSSLLRAPLLAFALPLASCAGAGATTAWGRMDATARAKAQACFDKGAGQAGAKDSRDDFRAHAPKGRVVELLHANHAVYLSNRAEVIAETRAFLAGER